MEQPVPVSLVPTGRCSQIPEQGHEVGEVLYASEAYPPPPPHPPPSKYFKNLGYSYNLGWLTWDSPKNLEYLPYF